MIVAIILGIVCSLFFPEWLSRGFVTINSIIGNFIGMFIPILILGLISPGISLVAAPGVPGGCIMASLGLLSSI